MTTPINSDLGNTAGVADNGNPVLLDLRFPSPQRGRGARGEGDRLPMAQRSPSARSQFWMRVFAMYLLVLGCATAPFLLAQKAASEKPGEKPSSQKAGAPTREDGSMIREQPVRKVFQIKYADVDKLAQVLRIFGNINADRDLRVIAAIVTSGVLPVLEDTIRRLDVPPPAPQNVELTVYLLLASDNGVGSVPPELEGVAKQLKTTFAFKGLHTIDTLVVRSRDKQSADVKGLARFDTDIPNPSTYSFAYRAATILSDEKGRSIRLDGLRFAARVVVRQQSEASSSVVGYSAIDAGFGTDVDVREGQKVVVGKAAVGGTNTALILVITAKVLE